CDEILLVDDASSAVSLPEVPLLGVLPGTGGLTRVVDKRKVRRDLADVFASLGEGVKGKRAVRWRRVDETAPRSKCAARTAARPPGSWPWMRPWRRRRTTGSCARCATTSSVSSSGSTSLRAPSWP